MRAFVRNLVLSFLITAAFPIVDGSVAGANDAGRSGVIAAPECPAGTNWDAVLKRCVPV